MHLNDSQIIYKYVALKAKISHFGSCLQDSQLKLTSTIPIHKINMLMHLNDSQIIYKYVAPKAKI